MSKSDIRKKDFAHLRKPELTKLYDGRNRTSTPRYKIIGDYKLLYGTGIYIPMQKKTFERWCIDCLIGLRNHIDELIAKHGVVEL